MRALSAKAIMEAIDANLRKAELAQHFRPFKHMRKCTACQKEMRETGSVLASKLFEPVALHNINTSEVGQAAIPSDTPTAATGGSE